MTVLRGPLSSNRLYAAFVAGMGAGFIIVALIYLLRPLMHSGGDAYQELLPQFSLVLVVALPFIQGIAAACVTGGYQTGRNKYACLGLCILAGDYVTGAVLLKEGYICLIIAFPLYLTEIVLGLFVGRYFPRMRGGRIHSFLLPLIVLAVSLENPGPPPDYNAAVSDAVTINAKPEEVWRYIVQYPENTSKPDYWLWQIGLPMPIQSVANGTTPGSDRECRFTGGVSFGERIVESVPNKVLTFAVTRQPDDPEILGHFAFKKGQLYLEANPDGTTTVIATSWYHLFVRPVTYFDWWTTDIVRHVHFRVLNHIKQLAETKEQASR